VSTESVDIQAIQKKVVEIISEQMGADKAEITRETSFINDLNEEAEKIQTVGAAIDYIATVAQSKSQE